MDIRILDSSFKAQDKGIPETTVLNGVLVHVPSFTRVWCMAPILGRMWSFRKYQDCKTFNIRTLAG